MKKNRPITEARALTAVIAGAPFHYIPRNYVAKWCSIVAAHKRGEELSVGQRAFIERTASYACLARARHKSAVRRPYGHFVAPVVFRG